MLMYAASYQDVLAGDFGLRLPQEIVASIDQGFVGVTKMGRRLIAVAVKSSYPNGPPALGQHVPENCRRRFFPRTRSATDRI